MSKKSENLLLLIWVVSLVATLGSLYFSEVRHYLPCEMCWYQRILMYPILLITTIAIWQKNAKIAMTTLAFSAIGGAIAIYHYGIQKLSFLASTAPACKSVSCTAEYINWLGFITIPFLSLVAFVVIIVASILLVKEAK
ncbi:putative disulfide formation protein C [Lysinibacillus alkalisoli]|uniref:Probable disulfide formation protein n=1 Tax=Lysinibacillus alkalisoli TaxID=1911548 RepID=A0A917LGM5_9BACI|nr:disulfide oxidoreductase [Lysinibacillus alkalisoli]GGG22689.1 putative disulfide formation protein C [Lysinibacillus alkalisoli]